MLQNLKILKNIFEISWKDIYIYIFFLRRLMLPNQKIIKNIFEISWKEVYIYILLLLFFEKIKSIKSKNSKKHIWDKLKINKYIYVWDMRYAYKHTKYNYLFQKT